MNRRVLGVALVIAGIVMMGAGALLLMTNDSGGKTKVATSTSSSTTSTTSTTATSTTTSTTSTTAPPETPQAFFAAFEQAIRGGNATFLFDRLLPVVFERYDQAACHKYLEGLNVPVFDTEVLSVGTTGSFAWTTDGLTKPVEKSTTTVRLRTTEDGNTFVEADSHVVVDGGVVRWITDCGSPKEGAT